LFFLLAVFGIGLAFFYTGIGNSFHFSYTRKDIQLQQEIRSSFDWHTLAQVRDSLEQIRPGSSPKLEIGPDEKINLNSAYAADLLRLPEIGEVIAERIIEYRHQIGKFTKVDQLSNVKGIGPKKLERIRNHLTID